jgi:hypothetical protein
MLAVPALTAGVVAVMMALLTTAMPVGAEPPIVIAIALVKLVR